MVFPEHQDHPYMLSLMRAIIDTAIDGIIVMDVSGIIVLTNPAADNLFGYSAEEMTGRDITTLMPSPHREQHAQYIQNYLQTGIRKIIGIGREVSGIRKDGTQFPLRLAVSESRLGDKLYFAGIIHDLSDVHQARQEILKLNQELEELVIERTLELQETVNLLLDTNRQLKETIDMHKASEQALLATRDELRKSLEKEKELNLLKSRFLSLASHEFKTPLASILSSAGLIARYDQADQAGDRLRHVERIKSSVTHLNNVLSDFLSISRLEEGQFEPVIQAFRLDDLLDELCTELRELLKPGQELRRTETGFHPDIQSDKQILRNILYNLFSNAIKYSEPGHPITYEIGPDDGMIRIRIRDEGIGIPVEDQKHIGTRFFRASNAVHVPGTGLGLNIVASYLQTLKGRFAIESEPGRGTTVTITLPLRYEA